MNPELLEKKRKLELLRANKKAAAQNPAGSSGLPSRTQDIDSLVDQILSEKRPEHPERKPKFEDHKESSVSPQKVPEKRKRKLEFVPFVGEVHIGKEIIAKYDQSIQVEIEPSQQNHPNSPNSRPTRKTLHEAPVDSHIGLPRISKIPPQMLNEIQHHKEKPEEKKEIPQDDVKTIIRSKNFQEFFDKTTKMIERALESDSDANLDIIENIIAKENVEEKFESKSDVLRHTTKFFDNNYCSNRIITSMEWSPNLEDLFLASYGQNEEGNINDPLGLVLLWSCSLKTRPEFYCFCQSPVTSACFYPYSHNLLIGGLYNGTIVIWDLRAKTTPVQRTTLSSGGHTFPIYSLAVVGSQNAHNIVSISNDGKLCSWNMNMLTTPNKMIDLKRRNLEKAGAKDNISDINVTCMGFPEGDPNNFYIGSEDGFMFQSQIHGNQTKEDNVIETFKGHEAPVTSISIMPAHHENPPFMNGLILTSSMDWTVKLWNPKISDKVYMNFESADDYIYDVSWNKSNSTVFGSVDGDGYIDLWDISGDLEVPLTHYKAGTDALHKLRWSKDGSKLLVGDAVGNVNLYNLDKRFLKTNSDKLHELESILSETPKN